MIEIGILRPDGLYIQAIAATSEAALALHPPGTLLVPLRPSEHHEWQGDSWAYVPPVPGVPASVTRAQALVALHEAGLLPAVEAAVEAHTYEVLRIWWRNALSFERANPYLNALADELELSAEDVDSLFLAAATRL
ncbi:hypothetical protein [Ancylobacter sp. TS-1]|uniref:hypothetical protein n=1 Tax=Ancylobacter sp. TS-1 TaxID=1850374 RepID=UPI001265CB27|nr:hypothetical protein [Ancylobacter sp. TS-1]QFR32377.1 hypothetical protein GBB76_04185 [Ancylobacter sp. TS-1]